MDSNPRENRLQNECSIDRISDLPDSILGQILSYLPIKDIVATSILSTRWKTIFPSAVPLTELDFDDSSCMVSSSSRKFMAFVDKLLNVTLRDVMCVEKVILNCEYGYDDDKIVSWVCAALRLNVKHLRLMSSLYDSEALFDSLHGCKTLVELELGNDLELCLPEEFMLPNLESLTLYSLLLHDDMDSIHKLIYGCPALEHLKFVACDFADLDTLYIQHPFINTFCVEGCCNQADCWIVIDAPNLIAFAYRGYVVANYVLKNTKPLDLVIIDFKCFGEEPDGKGVSDKCCHLAKLVSEFSSTTRLSLSGNSVRALCRSSVQLPTFQNLVCLALGHMGSRGWRMLARFLQSAPNLTILTFGEKLEFTGAYTGFKSLLPSVPVCLKMRIKTIEIFEFEWSPDEIMLIEYFLKNGKVLQELIVHCLPYENKSDLEKLSLLPRHSKACQVLFREKDIHGEFPDYHDNW